jgi:hypothetical protein
MLETEPERGVDQAPDDGEDGQGDEGQGHHPRGLVGVGLLLPPRLSHEHEHPEPGDVERGEEGGDEPDDP